MKIERSAIKVELTEEERLTLINANNILLNLCDEMQDDDMVGFVCQNDLCDASDAIEEILHETSGVEEEGEIIEVDEEDD